MVDYCMNELDGIGYVYNCGLKDFVPINTVRRDSRDFCHWVRALSLISQFSGWDRYKNNYIEWIINQKNEDGLWEFPKKYDLSCIPLSDSWRKKKNKVIDSTIMILRFLKSKHAY